jgi:hypothetical protein
MFNRSFDFSSSAEIVVGLLLVLAMVVAVFV